MADEKDPLWREIKRLDKGLRDLEEWRREVNGSLKEHAAQMGFVNQHLSRISENTGKLFTRLDTLVDEIHRVERDARHDLDDHVNIARARRQQEGSIRVKWLIALVVAAIGFVMFLLNVLADLAMRVMP